jgi:hypothetical protein
LARPEVKKFVGTDGNTYELTPAEIDYITAYAKKYGTKFAQTVNTTVLEAVKEAKLDLELEATKGNLPKENISETLEERIAEVTTHIVTDVSGTETIKFKTAQFVVPKFQFSQEERVAAAKALAANQAALPEWNKSARESAEKEIGSILSKALNVEDIWKVDTQTGNRPFQIWLQRHEEVKDAL